MLSTFFTVMFGDSSMYMCHAGITDVFTSWCIHLLDVKICAWWSGEEWTNYLKGLTSWLASNATLNLHFVSACKISLTKLTAVLYISTLDSDQANNATFIHSHTSHEETSCNISEIAVFICYWNKIQIKPEMRKYWHMSTVSRSYHNNKPHIIYDDFKAEILRKLFCGWVKVMCKCTREGWPWVMRLALFSCQHLVLNITQSSYLVADLCCQFIIIIL